MIRPEQSKLWRIVLVLPLALLFMLVAGISKGNANAPVKAPLGTASIAAKIQPEVLQATSDGKSASVIVLLADQADLSKAYGIKDQDARGWYVYNTLRDHATRSQAPLRAALTPLGVSVKSMWAANAIVVAGDRALIETLAARADVARIEADIPSKGISPMVEVNASAATLGVEWGVQRVRAPEVWALGFTGQGIVVGNQDTGMRWTHNAIKNQYRGWNGATADHNYNWWDAIRVPSPGNLCGYASAEPCDDDALIGGGHGTHTTGTSVGDDGLGNQVGVAPGAEWMGCRNMDRGVGRPSTYMECFQFFLAPTDLSGQNPDPTKRPHVMNNSWACVEGCAPDTLRAIVENSQAAGIFVEASAGNDGPQCSTVAFPPALYEASFSTGAIDINNTLANFSSRGPVLSDGSGRLKPNISAPGVTVRSALRASDTTYGNLSGTSMAGPHVVGVVALVWSARPDLVRDIPLTKQLLQDTANPEVRLAAVQTCGGTPSTTIPNNSFGYGRVDAAAAVVQANATVTPSPQCGVEKRYVISESTGAQLDPGGMVPVLGSQCDDCTVPIELPFPYYLYGVPYTTVNASSNGNLQFTGSDPGYSSPPWVPACLPLSGFNNTIFAFWKDLDLRATAWPLNGIFTSVTGTAPNRVFNIEWRACLFASGGCGGGMANFEVRLFEGQDRFEIVYGDVFYNNWPALVGVQKGNGSTGNFTQYACQARPFENGLKLNFNLQCPPPTPTATSTPTYTPLPTNTPTFTPTNTPLPTNTPIPSATNTPVPTNTPLPTNTPQPPTPTPEPCTTCGMQVTNVAVSCNLDGTVRWTATVHNKYPCTGMNEWVTQLEAKSSSGGFQPVAVRRGTGTFPQGYTTLSGDICYAFTPDIRSMRVETAIDSDNARCKPLKKSEPAAPCARGNCP
jgi:serine protease AprX